MTPERWQQIDRLLNEVLERPTSDREAFLAQAAAGDVELRREVESLLGFHQKAASFIEAPPVEIASDWLSSNERRSDKSIGHYQLIRELGRGGMGVVYLANDTRLGRQVALKLLLEKLTKDTARVRRFQREARAVSALNHPNIITVYEVGQTGTDPVEYFIAAEFVDGQTLREKCQSGGMPLGQALDVLMQSCAALNSAHEAGIIHRDIKPENIMLRHDGIVKVLDFGLAKLTEQSTDSGQKTRTNRLTTQPGVVMGTTSYMSPEQARGLKVDARSDVFSLGVVMYELLTGNTPFTGETTADVLAALLMGEPRSLNRYSSQLPAELQNIVSGCLAKSVEERFQSARELGDALKTLKEELEFSARLKGLNANSDDILNMNVGATSEAGQNDSWQTQFATRKSLELKTTVEAPPTQTSPSRFGTFRQSVRRHQRWLALATLFIITAMFVWWKLVPGKTAIESIAVLPLLNQIGDPQFDYLPDGITESLIDSLSQAPELTVRPTSMVLRYKNNQVAPRQAGKDLKVDAVVVGQAQRQNESFAVQIEIIRTGDGSLLWSQKYEGKLDGILAMQQEMSSEITNAILQRRNGTAQHHTSRQRTQNSEAYKLYVTGRTLWLKRSSESTQKAIELFQQAIRLDSTYALAYVGIADAYSTLGSYNQGPPYEVYPKAREAAEQALKLDSQLAEAHASLGKILTDFDWDWTHAENEFKQAIAMKPNYANAHHWYSTLLATEGRFDEAIREVKLAQSLDFLSPATNTHVGNILYRARRYNEAIVVLKETLALEPNFLPAVIYLGFCYRKLNRLDDALAEFQRSHQLLPNSHELVGLLSSTYAAKGEMHEARRYLAELLEIAKHRYVAPTSFMALYAALGDMDKAFEYLDKAFQEKSPIIRGLKTDPMFDPIRQDPRFQKLLHSTGLTQ